MDVQKLISDSNVPIAAIVILNFSLQIASLVLAFSGAMKNMGSDSPITYAILGISILVSYVITPAIVVWAGFSLAKNGSPLEECIAGGFLVALISGGINSVVSLLAGIVSMGVFASSLPSFDSALGTGAFGAVMVGISIISSLISLVFFSVGGLIFGLIGWGIAQLGKPAAKAK